MAHIGIRSAGSDHHLLNGLTELILAARVAGSQLTDGAVYIGLTPEDVRPVVEDVEVVGVIAFLLDDLELDVLVVQVGIESL